MAVSKDEGEDEESLRRTPCEVVAADTGWPRRSCCRIVLSIHHLRIQPQGKERQVNVTT
ncbi:hypothetical protein NG831_12320 [Xanthomonas sacchari]|uniref:hypothetical protein n=1 Tax=Xanthomonas TaxID=338 RepID=UPI00168BD380|nr:MULTISPECIES: hypothetical protein [Xanthomonas]UYK65032.1 hypothetical protein NG831_12320 [Xanthomonas sacchari]UYK75243.1 hypothetical protein NG825_11775 [Xanthomonas sacchari]